MEDQEAKLQTKSMEDSIFKDIYKRNEEEARVQGVYKELARIQKELKAPKLKKNSFGRYMYISCSDILEAVKPLLNGLVLVLNDKIITVSNRNYIEATAVLTDGIGKIEVTALAREPLDNKGMDDSQITGATSSYARKYALNGLFAIDDTKKLCSNEYSAKVREQEQRHYKPELSSYISLELCSKGQSHTPLKTVPSKVVKKSYVTNETKQEDSL